MRNHTTVTVLSLGAVAVFVALGLWQVARLQWKNDLIAKLNHSKTVEAKPILEKNPLYTQVKFSGTWDFDNQLKLKPRTFNGQNGYHVITPLLISNSNQVVLINRGWVKDKTLIPLGDTEIINAVGIIRRDDATNWFTPANDLAHKILYHIDIGQIKGHLRQLPPYSDKDFVDFYVVYQNPHHKGYPVPYDMLVNISNKHLGYAITWFSLAFAVLLLYIFSFKRAKR